MLCILLAQADSHQMSEKTSEMFAFKINKEYICLKSKLFVTFPSFPAAYMVDVVGTEDDLKLTKPYF